MTSKARATVHGAISIVNAVATGMGATMGTDQQVTAVVEASPGRGVELLTGGGRSRFISKTVEGVVPARILSRNRIAISVESDIPAGCGLKSSSAVSSAIALACAKLFNAGAGDRKILLAGVNAAIRTKISITGAYDDACACYYGGFNVTDNRGKRLILHENGPRDMAVVIFVPGGAGRGDVRRLKTLGTAFREAWGLAKKSDYWGAMVLNGLSTSAALGSDSGMITDLLEAGAVGASVSGNGPAVAAVTRRENAAAVRRVFAHMGGRTIMAKSSNKKAEARLL